MKHSNSRQSATSENSDTNSQVTDMSPRVTTFCVFCSRMANAANRCGHPACFDCLQRGQWNCPVCANNTTQAQPQQPRFVQPQPQVPQFAPQQQYYHQQQHQPQPQVPQFAPQHQPLQQQQPLLQQHQPLQHQGLGTLRIEDDLDDVVSVQSSNTGLFSTADSENNAFNNNSNLGSAPGFGSAKKCPNSNCKFFGSTQEINVHMTSCPERRDPCALCSAPVRTGDMIEHMNNHCPNRMHPVPKQPQGGNAFLQNATFDYVDDDDDDQSSVDTFTASEKIIFQGTPLATNFQGAANFEGAANFPTVALRQFGSRLTKVEHEVGTAKQGLTFFEGEVNELREYNLSVNKRIAKIEAAQRRQDRTTPPPASTTTTTTAAATEGVDLAEFASLRVLVAELQRKVQMLESRASQDNVAEIQRLEERVDQQKQEIDHLSATLSIFRSFYANIPPLSVDWMFTIPDQWESGKFLVSKTTLRFPAKQQELCYNFNLCVARNDSKSTYHLGVYIIPKGAANDQPQSVFDGGFKASGVRLSVLNCKGSGKSILLNNAKTKKLFTDMMNNENAHSLGCNDLLSKQDLEGNDYVVGGKLVVRAELIV